MLRQFLGQLELHRLPIVAMGIFLLLFVGVLVRVLRRGRATTWRRLAQLPLDDPATVRIDHDHR